MQHISVFDMMKIGVGPSSSHTMGPWRAAQRFLQERCADDTFAAIQNIQVELFGSLAKTGQGHGTDIAILMGLRGEDPATCDTSLIGVKVQQIRDENEIWLLQEKRIPFDATADLILHFDRTLPHHPNGMRFTANCAGTGAIEATYYSVGGGFVVAEGEEIEESFVTLPFPSDCGDDVMVHCDEQDFSISQMVLENEKRWRSESEIRSDLLQLWETMAESVYRVCLDETSDEDIIRFLLVAGEIGTLFKKGATISAAMGGCQAEIGVSSAMAAAALCECAGGTVAQTLMAAEIAMEHHLGLTCDPVGGLVQVPCIERNAMGAMKAITAVNLALESSPQHAKVSLDTVIRTMWQTALDMNEKYKETSEGGLAVLIPVNVSDC